MSKTKNFLVGHLALVDDHSLPSLDKNRLTYIEVAQREMFSGESAYSGYDLRQCPLEQLRNSLPISAAIFRFLFQDALKRKGVWKYKRCNYVYIIYADSPDVEKWPAAAKLIRALTRNNISVQFQPLININTMFSSLVLCSLENPPSVYLPKDHVCIYSDFDQEGLYVPAYFNSWNFRYIESEES